VNEPTKLGQKSFGISVVEFEDSLYSIIFLEIKSHTIFLQANTRYE